MALKKLTFFKGKTSFILFRKMFMGAFCVHFALQNVQQNAPIVAKPPCLFFIL